MPFERPELELQLAAQWPPSNWEDVTVLLAVSGGADSVAMLRAMVKLKRTGKGSLAAAHFNHQLRGQESVQDEQFVLGLCRQLAVACHVGRAPAGWRAEGAEAGLESSARRLRYDFLQETAGQVGARYVVTAHTADDQAETILHRILRGTGMVGLAGMRRARPLGPACTLMRPLLGIRRADLLAYLGQIDQPYRQDSSNDDLRFTRNRIRHQLLPQLAEQFNPSVLEALLRLGCLAGEITEVVEQAVEELVEQAVSAQPSGEVTVHADQLGDRPNYVVRQLLVALWRRQGWPLQAMGFAQWEQLATMLAACQQADSVYTKRVFPGNIRAESAQGSLRLSRLNT